MAVYVDDLLLISKNKPTMERLKEQIANGFKSKDMGEAHYILGLNITRDRAKSKLWINQEANANNVIQKFNMENANPSETPTASGAKLAKSQQPTADIGEKPFRQAVGSIMYLMIGSRPDLAYAIQDVSQYLNSYDKSHWEAVKRNIRYIKGRSSYGLEFSGGSATLNGAARINSVQSSHIIDCPSDKLFKLAFGGETFVLCSMLRANGPGFNVFDADLNVEALHGQCGRDRCPSAHDRVGRDVRQALEQRPRVVAHHAPARWHHGRRLHNRGP